MIANGARRARAPHEPADALADRQPRVHRAEDVAWREQWVPYASISDNLKRGGSFIPGVRPGKQTKDFLDGVISRITIVGAFFLSMIALVQYLAPTIVGIPFVYVNVLGGTSLLIVVSVALETLRQIEANLLMKRYGN